MDASQKLSCFGPMALNGNWSVRSLFIGMSMQQQPELIMNWRRTVSSQWSFIHRGGPAFLQSWGSKPFVNWYIEDYFVKWWDYNLCSLDTNTMNLVPWKGGKRFLSRNNIFMVISLGLYNTQIINLFYSKSYMYCCGIELIYMVVETGIFMENLKVN